MHFSASPSVKPAITMLSNLRSNAESINEDITKLNETIAIVEEDRSQFSHVTDEELLKRKQAIADLKYELKKVNKAIEGHNKKAKDRLVERDVSSCFLFFHFQTLLGRSVKAEKFAGLNRAIEEDNDRFIQNQEQLQIELINKQDEKLDQLSSGVAQLGNMNKDIQLEIEEQGKFLS